MSKPTPARKSSRYFVRRNFFWAILLCCAGCGESEIYDVPATKKTNADAPLRAATSLWELGPHREVSVTGHVIIRAVGVSAVRHVTGNQKDYYIRITALQISRDLPAGDVKALLAFEKKVTKAKKADSKAVDQAFTRWEYGDVWCEYELGKREWKLGFTDVILGIDAASFFPVLEQALKDAEALSEERPSLEL